MPQTCVADRPEAAHCAWEPGIPGRKFQRDVEYLKFSCPAEFPQEADVILEMFKRIHGDQEILAFYVCGRMIFTEVRPPLFSCCLPSSTPIGEISKPWK